MNNLQTLGSHEDIVLEFCGSWTPGLYGSKSISSAFPCLAFKVSDTLPRFFSCDKQEQIFVTNVTCLPRGTYFSGPVALNKASACPVLMTFQFRHASDWMGNNKQIRK